MGVSTSSMQLSGKLQRFAKEVASERKAIEATTLYVRGVMQAAFTSAGVKSSTAPVKSKLVNDHTGFVYGAGKAALIDKGGKPHLILPKSAGKTRAKRVKAAQGVAVLGAFGVSTSGVLGALGGGVASEAGHPVPIVHHPGSRGKHVWTKGRVTAQTKAPAVMLKAQVSLPMKAVFH